MRVLLVTNVFPPAIGGPATFGARLAEELFNVGHKVKVVCGTEDRLRQHDFPFHVVRAGIKGNRLQREFSLRLQLLKAAINTDIVYCMGLEHQCQWACRLVGKPYVLRIGGDSVWEGARNLGVTDLEPEAFYTKIEAAQRSEVAVPEQRRLAQINSAKSVVYVSEYLKMLAGAWCRERPPRERIILNGITVREQVRIPERSESEPLRLLFVGRQTNWKGVDVILLALRNLPDVHLTVAGYGPALPANMDLSRRLGLQKKVEFLGHVEPSSVEKLMSAHHVLILPSLYEGLSNTLLEAAAAGLACIASDRGGNPEVIRHNESGLLVDPFDVISVESAIKLLADNDAERKRMALKNREIVVSDFSMDSSVKNTIEALEETIGLRC